MTSSEELIRFISEELLESDEPIDADENLLAEDMVDSLGMLRLVAWVEATYGIKIPPEDFTIRNFRTAELLSGYIRKSLDARGE